MASKNQNLDLILAALQASKSPAARKVSKGIVRTSKNPVQKLALALLQKQIISVRDDQFGSSKELSDLTPDQWETIFSLIGPFFQLLLKMIGL